MLSSSGMQAGWPVHMLTVQYRMHRELSAFPNSFTYEGRLLDAPSVAAREAPCNANRPFLPLNFVDWWGTLGTLGSPNPEGVRMCLCSTNCVHVWLWHQNGVQLADLGGQEHEG